MAPENIANTNVSYSPSGEILEKATRVLTPEEKAQLEIEFVGKNGQRRKLEVRKTCLVVSGWETSNFESQMVLGRQKLKKSFQYEIKWRGMFVVLLHKEYWSYQEFAGFDHKFNTWIPREQLLEKGFTKIVQQFDDLEASREGAGQRDTAAHVVRKHLEDIGLDGDIAQYNEISGLSGGLLIHCYVVRFDLTPVSGQKIKLVIAACLWNNPQASFLHSLGIPNCLTCNWWQICVLDEPSNFLDREALGGLAVAIRDWAGAVVSPCPM